jgi:nucleotide-binding universal stress UspA family protein
VPLDGSPAAETILPLVKVIASATRADVVLVSAVTPIAVWDPAASAVKWEAEEAAAGEYVAETQARLAGEGLAVRSRLGFGGAADLILETAEDEDVDLIAMTTHGRSGLGRWVMGSVANKVLHAARSPLLLVRPQTEGTGAAAVPTISTVLVPLDGSELSQAVLPAAEEIAGAFGASLVLCSVTSTDWPAPGLYPEAYRQAATAMEKAAREALEQTASKLREQGNEVDCVVAHGSAASEIVKTAETVGAGLIAMSTHGRSGPGRWVMGSVADAVVRRTHLPCLLVRPDEAGAGAK